MWFNLSQFDEDDHVGKTSLCKIISTIVCWSSSCWLSSCRFLLVFLSKKIYSIDWKNNESINSMTRLQQRTHARIIQFHQHAMIYLVFNRRRRSILLPMECIPIMASRWLLLDKYARKMKRKVCLKGLLLKIKVEWEQIVRYSILSRPFFSFLSLRRTLI